jgi:hypothetical protein
MKQDSEIGELDVGPAEKSVVICKRQEGRMARG